MGTGASTSSELSCEHSQGLIAFKACQFEDAIAWFTLAMTEKQSSCLVERVELASLHICRSKAYMELGHIGKALDDAVTALELHPTSTDAYICAAATACHVEGGKPLARDYIAKACAMEPNNTNAINLKEALFINYQPREHGVGHVFSWGAGDEMQLGHGNTSAKAMPHVIDTLRGKQIVAVACGAMHTLTLSSNGEVYAWGNNQYGQCGLMDLAVVATPQLIPSFVGLVTTSIACGAGHSIAITDDGRSYSWGIGKQGQLGLGPEVTSSTAPKLISSLSATVEAVACGIAHTLLLLSDGDLVGFGQNQYGQLGIPGEAIIMSPSTIPFTDGPIRQVACGGAHSCLVNDNGKLYSCGSNSCGQLGLGHFEDTHTFQLVDSNGIPSLALVACGEEFSAAIAADKSQVFTWGLGIAGQMGDNTLDGYCSPHLVPGIEEPVEMLSVSQAQVFAITERGSVYSWGLPGDRAYDSSAMVPSPERVGAFFGKKRLQTLACGRKHYVLITHGAFAPFSKLTWNPKCQHIAGIWCHFDIQTFDARGAPCETGGYVFTSYLTLVESKNQVNSIQANDSVVEINDNMNGTYSGRYRCYVAGEYFLNITLDHLGISGHPHAICVSPSKVFPTMSYIDWCQPLTFTTSAKSPLLGELNLRDRYGNIAMTNNCSDEDEELRFFYQIVDSSNQIVHKESSTSCSLQMPVPSLPGTYAIHIGIDGTGEGNTIRDNPFELVVQKDKTSSEHLKRIAERTQLEMRKLVIAGEEFGLTIELDEALPDDCYYEIRMESTTKSHTLSARALVRWGPTDPLAPTIVQTRKFTQNTAKISLKVAGTYRVDATLMNESCCCPIHSGELIVEADHPAPEFTALTNWKDLLKEDSLSATRSSLQLQLHDKFGNLSTKRVDDCVQAWLHTSKEEINLESRAQELMIESLSDSTLSISFPRAEIQSTSGLWLHIHLNSTPIEYSPFELASGVIEPPKPPSSASIKKLQPEEATRRRANEVLRRERARLREAQMRKEQQQNLRRTGGGFTIKYSQ